jgi:hypothetical protein
MAPHEELLQKIAIVRSRWKTFLWVRGLAWVLGVTVVSLLIGLKLADSPGISGWTVPALRLFLLAVVVATIVKALVMPLRRTPSDSQLARFIEEKNPGLQDSLVSAVDAIKKARPEQLTFVHLLTKDVLDRTKNVRFGDQVNKRKFSTFAALTGVFAVALLISLYVASLFFPIGSAKLLALNLLKPPAVDAIELKVTPGNTTVPKGQDVTIQAIAQGFDPSRAQIHLRYANGSEWEVSTMEPAPQNQPTFRHLLFNVQEPVHYFVDAAGYRSKEFTIDVADLPRVEKVDYAYHYPAYTGLAVKKEENGSDIVALKGTEVDVTVTGSQPLSGGRVVFADGKSIPLQPMGERTVMGKVMVDRNTSFRIELTNTSRAKYLDLEERSMEATDDQKPLIEFTKPGRDTKATNVEEVFTELKAEDDFGVRQLELHFSVNGGPDQKVDLFASKGDSPKEISAGHTFFLEEYKLQPGDIITYYGKAVDTKMPANTVSTDVYFIDVRPFGREYRQGQQGGGGGGGQGDDSAEALSKRQRDIIAATHKLINNKDKYKDKEWADDVQSIAANQLKNAEQANTLLERMNRRGLTSQDKMIKQMAEDLKAAIDQMTPAADQLKAQKADAAEPFEQKALMNLMRAEALFNEIQVSLGGGGGGGGAQSAQDIADLFELELDQNKNQYETVQRGEQQQQNSAEVDEALRKLKELSERQQKLQQRKAQQQQAGGGGGGQQDQMSAQDLQKETEKLARQLDKLSRENNDRQMADAARALNQAAQNMQQAQNGGSPGQQQQASQQAQEQLQKAQRLLSQGKNGSMEDRLAKVQEQAKRLKDEQSKIANETQQLADNPGAPGEARSRANSINQQKDGVAQDLKAMTNELESLGNNSDNRDAANKARTAANTIKGEQLQERIEQARQFLDNGTPQNNYFKYAEQQERQIEKGLDDVARQVGQAASAANNSDEKKLQNALNQTSESIQSLESMQRRLQQLQQQGQGQQQSQQNQQGQRSGQGQQQGQGQGQGSQSQQQGQGQGQGQGSQAQQQGQGQGQGQGSQAQQQGQGQGQGQGSQGQQQGQGQGSQGQGSQGQGQGQAQGGGRQGGNPQGNPQGGQYGGNNAPYTGQYAGGQFDPRQAVRELQQRLNEIRDIQNQLGPKNPLSQGLDQVARNLQQIINDPKLGDPRAVDKLEQQVIDPFKGVELDLSKALQILLAKDNIRSLQEDEIPQGYQKLVEEYYKKLSSPKN